MVWGPRRKRLPLAPADEEATRMSSGGSVPSAPSIAGVGQSAQTFNTATNNAAQGMNTAQAANTTAQNNLQSTLGTTNSAANNISNVANANLGQYQNTFMPLQQQEAQQAQQYGSNANIQQLQGQAIGNVNAANQASQQNNAAALAAEGVDPASIHGGAIQAANSVQNAANAANAGTQAGIQAQQQAFGMTNTANQLGLNVNQQGTAGAATGAQTAQAGQQAANQTGSTAVGNLANANSMLGQANTATQAGTAAQQAQFQDQMATYNAQQAQQSSTMSGIGSLVGAAAMFMEGGGPVPMDRGIPVYAEGGPVQSGYVPPMYPTPAQPSYVPRATQFLAGGHTTSVPAYPYARAANMSAGGQVMQQGALPTSPIPGSTDTKPALLTPGEFVFPKDVVDHLGHEKLHKMIDSVREKANKRRAIPIHHPPHVSMQ